MARPRKLPSLESDSPVIIPGANNGIIKIDDDKTKLPVPLRSSIISKLAARRALYQASPLANRPIQIGGGVFPKTSCARGDLLFCGIVVSGLCGNFNRFEDGFLFLVRWIKGIKHLYHQHYYRQNSYQQLRPQDVIPGPQYQVRCICLCFPLLSVRLLVCKVMNNHDEKQYTPIQMCVLAIPVSWNSYLKGRTDSTTVVSDLTPPFVRLLICWEI